MTDEDCIFINFLACLKDLVDSEGANFDQIRDHPIGSSINLTFLQSEERIVDAIVRKARINLLKHNEMDLESYSENGFTFAIVKSFIRSHRYWSLDFSISERYQFIENSQP